MQKCRRVTVVTAMMSLWPSKLSVMEVQVSGRWLLTSSTDVKRMLHQQPQLLQLRIQSRNQSWERLWAPDPVRMLAWNQGSALCWRRWCTLTTWILTVPQHHLQTTRYLLANDITVLTCHKAKSCLREGECDRVTAFRVCVLAAQREPIKDGQKVFLSETENSRHPKMADNNKLTVVTYNLHGLNQGITYLETLCNEYDIVFVQTLWTKLIIIWFAILAQH